MKRASKLGAKERLLRIGLEEFAKRGYDGATVRDICDRARSNIAGINYYFGDKRQFYLAVRRQALQLRMEESAVLWELAEKDIWQATRRRIELLLEETYDERKFQAQRLFMRELMECDVVDDAEMEALCPREDIRSHERHTRRFLQLLLCDAATLENMKLLHYSFGSLCLFLPIQKTIEDKYFRRLPVEARTDSVDRNALVEHILNVLHHIVDDMKQAYAASVKKED